MKIINDFILELKSYLSNYNIFEQSWGSNESYLESTTKN